MAQLMVCVGLATCYTVGAFLDWRPMAWMSLALVPVFVILMFLQPESPGFYLAKDDTEAARKSLMKLRGNENNSLACFRLLNFFSLMFFTRKKSIVFIV